MRAALLAAALAMASTAAAAQSRPDSLTMTCQQARALVASRGAVVLGTGRYIYDRYVLDDRFCGVGEVAAPAWVRTRDTPQCLVGGLCKPAQDYFWWD